MTSMPELRILQFCHGYDGPFLDCARQYASLFEGTPYKVTTVFLTGRSSADVAKSCRSDEVIFMEYRSRDLRGLKLKAVKEFREIAGLRQYLACIAHRSKPTYVACLATSLPVLSVHHAFGDYQRITRRWFAQAFRKRLQLLAVSDAVREDIRNCLPTWPDSQLQTLHNRIDVPTVRANLYSREEARDRLKIPHSAWVVGNVGRLHPDKDQATLLRGFAVAQPNLPKGSMLVICGNGRLENQLRSLAAQLGLSESVILAGEVPEARRLFKAFDLFALTSDHEPFGMVLLEAMAAEVPVISTNCGGAPEVVDDCGMLFTLRDAMELGSRMVEASQMPSDQIDELRRKMSDRLNTYFTDEAARRKFWSLPQLAWLQQR